MIKTKKNIYLLLLLFSILPYNYFSIFLNSYSNIINIFIYVIRALLLFYVVYYLKNLELSQPEKKELKNITVYFIFIFMLNFISSLLTIEYTKVSSLMTRCFSMLYMYCFYVYMIYNYKYFDKFNVVLKNILTFLLFFSLFLYAFYPTIGRFYEGYNVYPLVGVAANRNSYYELMMPLVVTIFLLKKNKRLNFFNIILILLVILTVIMTKSVTSIISLIVFFLIIILNNFKSFKFNIIKIGRFLIVFILLIDFIFIAFNVDLGKISSSFANKSTTMSGRTIIWQKAMYYFEKSPIVGYGYDNNIIGSTDNYILQGNNKFPNDTHNSILFMLLSSGIIGTIYLLFMIVRSMRYGEIVYKHDKKYIYIFAYIFSMLIRGLTESCYHYPHAIFFLYIIYTYIKYYDIKKEKENEFK